MAVRKVNEAKCTVWTETIRMDFSGPILGCALQMFSALPASQRAKALEKMTERDAEMKERETQRAAEGGAA